MRSFYKCKSYSHFFSKNISIYAIFNDQSFNDTLTNNIYSFEQLGPDKSCVTSKDSDQPVHPPSMARAPVYSSLDSLEAVEGTCDQQRPWSDCTNAQADLSLHWSSRLIVDFVLGWLIFLFLFLCKNLLYPTCRHSLEMSWRGKSDELPENIFFWKSKKYINILWLINLFWSYEIWKKFDLYREVE